MRHAAASEMGRSHHRLFSEIFLKQRAGGSELGATRGSFGGAIVSLSNSIFCFPLRFWVAVGCLARPVTRARSAEAGLAQLGGLSDAGCRAMRTARHRARQFTTEHPRVTKANCRARIAASGSATTVRPKFRVSTTCQVLHTVWGQGGSLVAGCTVAT